jgi:hypothetical protein
MATETKKTTTLSPKARELLNRLNRDDVDYTSIDMAAFHELRAAGLANVIFGATGNRVFATRAGKAA